MKQVNKTPATIKAPAFDTYAKPLIKGFEAFDNATAKLSATVEMTFQAYIDVCAKAGVARDKAGVQSIGKAIRECETLKPYIESGAFEKSTFTNYAQSAMRAYYHEVPFAPSLFTNKEMGLPWGKTSGGASDAKTSGKVQSTSRAELDKTLSKALAQARLLGLTEFAANVLDLCLESLDDFKEIK
jgi:hypothetical protein